MPAALRSKHQAKAHVYKQLPNTDDIRIVNLLPGVGDDEIRCEVTVENSAAASDTYDAISYCWGDAAQQTTVICDGATLLVTFNLADALRAIRHPKQPHRLWIDSISIDQHNDLEKNHQVKAMGKIFENAREVLVWLGHDRDGIAADCFRLIRETNQYLDEQLEKVEDLDDVPRLREPYGICSDPSQWDKVRVLLRFPWFTRVWVVQEAGLAKSCLLIWGERRMDLAELIGLALWYGYRSDVSAVMGHIGLGAVAATFCDIQCSYSNPQSWKTSKTILRSATEWQREGPSLFLDILYRSGEKNATDPRDHVYAYLGHPLARQIDGQLIVEPEYDRTVVTVYLHLAQALLKYPREAHFLLSRVRYRSTQEFHQRGGPSWVPHWTSRSTSRRLASPLHWYTAGGSGNQHQVLVEVLNHHQSILHIQGFRFDRVTWTSTRIRQRDLRVRPLSLGSACQDTNEPFIDKLRQDVINATSCVAEQVHELEEAFGLTLAGGYPGFHGPLQDEDLQDHRRWYAAYLQAVRSVSSPNNGSNTEAVNNLGLADDPHVYEEQCLLASGHAFACTAAGRFGLVPTITQLNDVCCIFLGVSVPFILRPAGGGRYHLLGECYIHGTMGGELMPGLLTGEFQQQTISLA